MQYPSINIQGNIVSNEIISKLSDDGFKYQNPESFELTKNDSLRDEIGNAWAVLRRQWETFKVKRGNLDDDKFGLVETRRYWVNHLMNELGYEIEARAKAEREDLPHINSFCSKPHQFPIQVEGFNQSLDKKPTRGGSSPHGRMQEYLNKIEHHLYGFVCNGKYLRLLRDASRLIKLTYLEFNLEKMMEEELYADFAIMYRLLHGSRTPQAADDSENSIIEYYHQESLATGTRIREKLSLAVEDSIRTLANGFLQHSANNTLKQKLENNELDAEEYYKNLLRLIYRILFLSVTEERNLVYEEDLNEEQKAFRDTYYSYYSIERHRKLAENHLFVDKYKHDLWENILATFRLFENEYYGSKLNIKPLGGELFGHSGIGILSDCRLGNDAFIKMMLLLNFFEDERKQKVRVNYGDLDVEEFGSVYEGLLEYDPHVEKVNDQWEFTFKKGDERSRSGSHYTPEELVKPLIKHSLDYIIQDCIRKPNERLQLPEEIAASMRKQQLQEKSLLSITVCDVACGSGHILLSAARRIALELARVRTIEEQPAPSSIRKATRDVIRHCIYGVDLNPLAVELCKVALWLEAHNPGEPLNFLDHKIKCGNALVGLAYKEELQNGIADEAFKTLPGDDKEVAADFRKRNAAERKNAAQVQLNFEKRIEEPLENLQKAFDDFAKMPETTPEEIEAKEKAYKKLTSGENWWRLKQLADLQVAQFFIPKDDDNKDRITTDGEYRQILRGEKSLQNTAVAAATSESLNRRFFHYFLEFPEVFSEGGFDCILGNPPFLGGKRISGFYGDSFLNYIKINYAPADGGLDLVTYFFKRDFEIINEGGFQSLISTNTIAQGDTRIGGLLDLINQGGVINHAVRSMKWPGLAAVEVSLVTVFKGAWEGYYYLNNREVPLITSYLDNQKYVGEPCLLVSNSNLSFIGSVVNGKGFILSKEKAKDLLIKNPKNKDILFPYLTGQDLNNRPDQSASRWIINFFDWSENKASRYYECYDIVKRIVKPDRDKVKRKTYRENWWLYAERGVNMYKKISTQERVLVVAQVSKTVAFSFVPTNQVISMMCVAFAFEDYNSFSVLQSTFHKEWVVKYGSALKNDTRYTPTDVFENFPFPSIVNIASLGDLGEKYYELRFQLMQKIQLGLTKAYNQFHSKKLSKYVGDLSSKEFQKKFGKEIWNLFKHLEIDKAGQITFAEAVDKIMELRKVHKQMDEAVLAAYGWDEDSEKWGSAIQLSHDFYEVDYLPENDNIRYTIHPEARKEILKRLLLLNHERFEEEAKRGLHKEKDVKEFYKQKGKEIPEEVAQHFKKAKKSKISSSSKPQKESKKETSLFEATSPLFSQAVKTENKTEVIQKDTRVELQSLQEKRFIKVELSDGNDKAKGSFQQVNLSSGLGKALLGKRKGDIVKVGDNTFKVLNIF